MTLDAMDWVWNHSQSRGNARIALLYVADQVRTSACEVRLSYADFLKALHTTSRSTVSSALTAAEKLGELVVAEEGSGRRGAKYRLPKAVDYVRPALRSGPEVGPQDDASGPELGPLRIPSGPETGLLRDAEDSSSGPEVGPLDTRSGPEVGPPLPTTPSQLERAPEPSANGRYPEQVLPLMHAMSASGLVVRWPWVGDQWFPIIGLVLNCGVDAMVDHALRAAANSRTPVTSAKYFLPGWMELPPKPPEGTPARTAPSNGARSRSQLPPEERGIF